MSNELTAEELVELYAPKVPATVGGISAKTNQDRKSGLADTKNKRKVRQGGRQLFGPSTSYGRDIKQPSMPTPTISSRASFMDQAAKDSRASFMAQQEAAYNAQQDAFMQKRQDAALARIRAAQALEAKKARE